MPGGGIRRRGQWVEPGKPGKPGNNTVKHTISTNIYTQLKAKQEQIPKCVLQGQREHMGSVGGA